MSVIQGAVYAASYVAATAGSTAVLTVTAPDATTTTPAVSTSASVFTASVPAAQVGAYLLVWTIAGTITDVQVDQFTVTAPTLQLISLSDLRDQINVSPTDQTGTLKLRRFISSAGEVVKNIVGPVLPQTENYVVDGGGQFLMIPRRWIISITLVVETIAVVNYTLTEQPLGSSYNNYGYTWDRAINKIVRRGAAGIAIPFTPGVMNVSCTYVSGMSTIPQDITDATGELIRHWWANGQQPWRAAFQPGGDDTGFQPVMGYAIPNRVMEMLMPYRKSPGIF